MRIQIRNVGPLKEVDLELPPMLALIGPQASGKTTLAKVIYLFEKVIPWNFAWRISHFAENYQTFQDFYGHFYNGNNWELRSKVESLIGFREDYHKDIYIECEYNENISLCFSMTIDGYLDVKFLKIDDKWINDLLFKNSETRNIKSDDDFLELRRKCHKMFYSQYKEINFMPHKRSSFIGLNTINDSSIFKNDKDAIKEDYISMSSTFNLVDIQRRSLTHLLTDFPREEKPAQHALAALIPQIIKADIAKKSGSYGLEINGNTTVPIFRGSSGQQETFSVLTMAASILINNATPVSLTVEEPEAGLFPEGQEKLVRALALAFNANPDNRVTLTTHSPYILTALDNLVQAYEIAQTSPENRAKVAAVIPETMWIPFDQLGVYLVQDGVLTPIKDMEARSVGGQAIDSVSDTIGNTYNQLLHIRYGED